ncbi:MAG: type III-A CRISPR-associated RAMP protein Csm3 [Phycisphaerales bacterium]|nr:type III-A CRISPR-associated RAMP protein Csm3 [Phycisphaerales bacterium]
MHKLTKKIFIEGTIQVKTGIRIGGSSSSMSIGGVDNIIIRNPINNHPYIPGSSIKGKMRSLIEQEFGEITIKDGKNLPSDNATHLSCRLFGASADKNNNANKHPSRLIVRDSKMNTTNEDRFKNCDTLFAEIKTEVVIDRVTARATPRSIERVPAGAEFSLELILNIFEGEDEQELMKGVFTALKLVEDDYLGGGGSRGNGQVKFSIAKLYEKDGDYYKNLREKGKCLTEKYRTEIAHFPCPQQNA